jgi:hypothetical protein
MAVCAFGGDINIVHAESEAEFSNLAILVPLKRESDSANSSWTRSAVLSYFWLFFPMDFRKGYLEKVMPVHSTRAVLFQWGGPYSWDPHFSINLTRQFTHNDEDSEYEGMEQLQMDCKFVADDSWPESGNRWLVGSNISEFLKEVLTSNAVLAAGEKHMISIDWDLNDV